MLTAFYWVVGIFIAIVVVGVVLVLRFVLYGIGLLAIIIILGGVIAHGIKEARQTQKPPDKEG